MKGIRGREAEGVLMLEILFYGLHSRNMSLNEQHQTLRGMTLPIILISK